MGEASPGTAPSERPLEDRLDSWKEIAAYLKRDVTTVQRWEKREGMPVHRHLHDRMGSVYASRAELDAWMRSRNLQTGQENGSYAISPNGVTQQPQPGISTLRKRWIFALSLAVAAGVLSMAVILWLQRTERLWRNPIANARFQTVTDFDALQQAAAVSRDGQFVAFLSNRDGPTDVWVTQLGSGEFHNLTNGKVPDMANQSIRALGFSPDGSLVTFWVRKPGGSTGDIGIWAVPTLGGEPRPYLEGAGEFDWSRDGSRLVYHTPGSGDPLFVTNGRRRSDDKPIFTGPAGLQIIFRCGRRTRNLFILSTARYRTNWTSGAFAQAVEHRNESRGRLRK